MSTYWCLWIHSASPSTLLSSCSISQDGHSRSDRGTQSKYDFLSGTAAAGTYSFIWKLSVDYHNNHSSAWELLNKMPTVCHTKKVSTNRETKKLSCLTLAFWFGLWNRTKLLASPHDICLAHKAVWGHMWMRLLSQETKLEVLNNPGVYQECSKS